MPLSILSTLPKSARTAFPFIESGVRQGLSSRSIERTIRSAGLSISRTRTILPLMREIQSVLRAGQNIRFIPKDNTINTAKLPTSITGQRRLFSYKVRIDALLPTGEQITRFVTVATDRDDMTPGQIENIALETVESNAERYAFSVAGATLQSGTRRGDDLLT